MHTDNLINRARRSVLKSIGLLGGLVAARQVQAHHTETHLDEATAHRIVYQCNQADPEYLQHILFSAGEMLRKYGDDRGIRCRHSPRRRTSVAPGTP